MGQAAVDLPDPMQDAATAHAGGADDILAQLADNEIDRLLAESGVEKPIAASAGSPPAVKAPPTIDHVPLAWQVDVPIETEPTAVELEIPTEPPPALLSDHDGQHAQVQAVRHTPLWLKPLQWMSAPLDAGPASLRDAIGKTAIITSINAIALLAYVAVFHRHH